MGLIISFWVSLKAGSEGLGGRQFNLEMVPGSRHEGTAGGGVKGEEPVREPLRATQGDSGPTGTLWGAMRTAHQTIPLRVWLLSPLTVCTQDCYGPTCQSEKSPLGKTVGGRAECREGVALVRWQLPLRDPHGSGWGIRQHRMTFFSDDEDGLWESIIIRDLVIRNRNCLLNLMASNTQSSYHLSSKNGYHASWQGLRFYQDFSSMKGWVFLCFGFALLLYLRRSVWQTKTHDIYLWNRWKHIYLWLTHQPNAHGWRFAKGFGHPFSHLNVK